MSPTHTHILDVAERLFAEQGVEAVSVQQVAEAANVNMAVVCCHIRDRDELVQQVIRRIVGPMNAARLGLLTSLEAALPSPQPLALDRVLRAFIAPVYELIETRPHAAWLLAYLAASPDDKIRREFDELLVGLIARFSGALQRTEIGTTKPVPSWTTLNAMIPIVSKESREGATALTTLVPDVLIDDWIRFVAIGMRVAT